MKNSLNILLFVMLILLVSCTGNSVSKQSEANDKPKAQPPTEQPDNDRQIPPVYYKPFDDRYSGGGFYALIDGKFGSSNFGDGKWQGFSENSMDVVIDLGKKQKITAVYGNFMKNLESWTFPPKSITILTSNDLKEFTEAGTLKLAVPTEAFDSGIEKIGIENLDVFTRYLRVQAEAIGPVPDWYPPAKGRKGWLFIDEIIIE